MRKDLSATQPATDDLLEMQDSRYATQFEKPCRRRAPTASGWRMVFRQPRSSREIYVIRPLALPVRLPTSLPHSAARRGYADRTTHYATAALVRLSSGRVIIPALQGMRLHCLYSVRMTPGRLLGACTTAPGHRRSWRRPKLPH